MKSGSLAERHAALPDQERMLVRLRAEETRQNRLTAMALVVVTAAIAWSAWGSGFSLLALVRGLPNIASFFWYDLMPPNPAAFTRYLYPAFETLMMAYLAAVAAAVLSIGLGVLGARTLMPWA